MAAVNSGNTDATVEAFRWDARRARKVAVYGYEFFDDLSYQADWKLMSRECQLSTMLEF